jgi:hypothetical protein
MGGLNFLNWHRERISAVGWLRDLYQRRNPQLHMKFLGGNEEASLFAVATYLLLP